MKEATSEIEKKLNRNLNALFNEKKMDTSRGNGTPEKENHKSALHKLTAIVLALDWEITDRSIQQFIHEVGDIKSIFHKDQIVVIFLTILLHLGRYIRLRSADSHPNAMELLNSTFICLFRILSKGNLSETDKKRYLLAEIKKYKKLREEIHRLAGQNRMEDRVKKQRRKDVVIPFHNALDNKALPPENRKSFIPHGTNKSNDHGRIFEKLKFSEKDTFEEKVSKMGKKTPDNLSDPAFINAIDEIKQLIQTEFKDLKKEVKRWPLVK